MRNGSKASDTPTPGYARNPVPAHSANDDGDGVGEPLADTNELRVTDDARLGDTLRDDATLGDTLRDAGTDGVGEVVSDGVALGDTDTLGDCG